LGAALVNIGASTTSLAVFEEGELLHTAVIPIGSEHITADVAIGLRCPINLADRIKLEHGSASPKKFNRKEDLDVSEIAKEEQAEGELEKINRKYLAQIIEARVDEIFEKIDEEFKHIDRSGMLPGGVFLIGGGTKLNDIVDSAKKVLRLPATLGTNSNVDTIIDKVNETEFITALGLVVWGNNVFSSSGKFSTKIPGGAVINKSVDKAKKWIQSLIP